MTEAEWFVCDEPTPMLEFLRGKASDRKLRLFAVACCRRMWDWIVTEEVKPLIVLSEEKADCQATEQEWDDAFDGVRTYAFTRFVAWDDAYIAACDVSQGWVHITDDSCQGRKQVRRHVERPAQSKLLRDIFGSPFHISPLVPPAVLAWNDHTVPRIAQAIYDERQMPQGTLDAGRLAILADALLDAGCEDEALLEHLRSEGPHVRGCWAVDVILGKS